MKPESSLDGVAIVGLSGRFPGAESVDEFWQHLQHSKELISFFTQQDLEEAGVPSAALSDPSFVKARAIISDVDCFDAPFFGFNPREAELLDPQHRLFLECAWAALENAGYTPDAYEGLIGVYAGTSISTYLLHFLSQYQRSGALSGTLLSSELFQTLISSDKDFLSTRVSYKLNLKGPSFTVQTGCSTSLVAVHLACQSLLGYECDMALAGGASVSVPHKAGHFYQEGSVFSPDGHCRAFDADGRGFVSGNGVGIVCLKRLADAIADRDCIYGVIKGSAINNDGAAKVGYSAPSIEGQAAVIAMAQAVAEIDPETISYIEAHGTGTPVGDPIEIAALNQVFRASTAKKNFCAIGSIKTNIGHTDHAAGVMGLIKTALALKHKQIPASLHFEQPNPQIDFASSPFYVNRKLSDWQPDHWPRRAGVSAFGIGGTNAHLVLEEAPAIAPSSPSRPWQLLLLSAKTKIALDAATTNLGKHLQQHPELDLADVAYTTQVGRKGFHHRRMVVVGHQSNDVALHPAGIALEMADPRQVFSSTHAVKDRSVVFMFSGQGSQYVNMAAELYQAESVFRDHVDDCAERLKPHLNLDLRHVLYPDPSQLASATQHLQQTAITQPTLFVIEYALAKLLMQWGVHPQAMIGHSIGEYVAACLAGVFSLDAALELVATRGQLMQSLTAGAMLAVPLSEQDTMPWLGEDCSLAAVNAPSMCVVSGSLDAISHLEAELNANGIMGRRLHTSHAFHSAMMEPILDRFIQCVSRVDLKPPTLPYLSNLTGDWITPSEATDPQYWANHLRRTVRFSQGVQVLLQNSEHVFLEVGPGRTLNTLVKRHLEPSAAPVVLSSLRHPDDSTSDVKFLLTTLGQLWLSGLTINWSEFYARENRHRVPLPTYPFERQRYWLDAPQDSPVALPTASGKRSDVSQWFYLPAWKQSTVPCSTPELTLQRHWLVFVDRTGLGAQLVKQLEQAGQIVTTVAVADDFNQSGRDYAINPARPEDYDALMKDLFSREQPPEMIVHLWTMTERVAVELGNRDMQELSFYSLLFLTQAIGRYATGSMQLEVLTNYVQDVSGSETLCPEKATLLGACKVIPQEYPNLTCRTIDLNLPHSGTWQEKHLLDQLIAEMLSQATDLTIAYRGQQRWVQTFKPVRLDPVQQPSRLRERGVYLITGGLGGIGLTLAQYLAQTVQAKLVLVGRSFPQRDEWDAWLAMHGPQDLVSTKIHQLKALEALGSEVLVVTADVTNRSQMQTAIAQAQAQFGAIHGVIHSAGVVGEGMIQLKTPELAAGVLASRLKGVQELDQLLGETNLDFLVLCSSLSSVLGGIGQVDYCAGNAFLDAFARCNASRSSTFTVAIDWDSWQEVGMAVNKNWRKELLEQGISSREGVEVFARILEHGFPQVAVSTRDLQERLQQAYAVSTPDLTSPKSTYQRPSLDTDYVAPRDEIEQKIAGIWQDILGIERVGVYDHFFDLGGHSLLVTQLISRLQNAFRVELPMQALFESRTIADSAAVVASQLFEQTDSDILNQALAEIEQLSTEEVLALLGNNGN